ncbi:hypothetical protein WA026_003895 [Henosepilachna vigintioctopunctata]|uniref:Uncharacterized protein n=1 Tax=Henosepilachna vigintioctopunctata TaxID=420089 RepID=A0AAW1UEA6_9CUCU
MIGLPLYIISFVLVLPVIKGQLPSYIVPCHLGADFSECALKNAKAAVPSLLDEYSAGNLRLNGTDVVVKGFENFEIIKILYEKENNVLGLELSNPLLEIDFHINIDGKIGGLAIEGNGPANFKLFNASYVYKFFYNTNKKDGKTYASYDKDDFITKPTKLSIQIDNLFNGNKLLGDNMNKVLNENWPEVLNELRPVVSEVVGSVARRMLMHVFRKVPLEDLFLGY